LARAQLRDALRQVSRAQGLAIPRILSDEQVREMISNMSQLQIAELSKDHVAQLREVAKAGAGEATKAFKAAISALISVISEAYLMHACTHLLLAKTRARIDTQTRARADIYTHTLLRA